MMSRRNYKTFVESFNNAAFHSVKNARMYFVATKFAANGIRTVLGKVGMELKHHAGNTYSFSISHVGMKVSEVQARKAVLLP